MGPELRPQPDSCYDGRTRKRGRRTLKPGKQKTSDAAVVEATSRAVKWWPVVLFVATALLYGPALDNQLLRWDDEANFVENANFRGLDAARFKWMWTTYHMGPYQPLSWMSLAVDYLIWGTDAAGRLVPTGFYLTNLLLHSLNVVLVYYLILKLLRFSKVIAEESNFDWIAPACATFGALLFGWHPLRVESVAWATERRDVLSTAFLLGSVLCYLRACEGATFRQYLRTIVVAWLLYVASLLSKVMGMTLPVVLLLLDIYPLRRLPADPRAWPRLPGPRRILAEKIPFALVAAVGMVLAMRGQREHATLAPWDSHPLIARVAQAAYGLVWYCLKTIWPSNLSPLYPLNLPLNLHGPLYWFCGLAVVAITAVLWFRRRQFPAALTAWCCFGVLVSPVLGLTQSGPQIVADRYSYLPCIPWAVLAAGGLAKWLSFQPGSGWIRMARGAGLAIIVLLGGLTLHQLAFWRNDYALWSRAVQVNELNAMAHHNLGRALADVNRTKEARDQYSRALELQPGHPDYLMSLGTLLYEQGEKYAGIVLLRRSCQLNPRKPRAFYNLAVVLAASFDDPGADAALTQAVTLDPAHADFYREGIATVRRNRTAEPQAP